MSTMIWIDNVVFQKLEYTIPGPFGLNDFWQMIVVILMGLSFDVTDLCLLKLSISFIYFVFLMFYH